jgi:beta-lactamase regulating signal transducer with metallopeptidase domain
MTAFHETARILAECLLNSMAEGVAIALLAWVVLRIFDRRSSSTRFAVWFSALIVIAALPGLHGFAAGAASAHRGTPVSAFTLPGSWVMGVVLAWALIATMGVLRVVLGLRQLRRLRAGSAVIDPATLDPRLQRTLQEFPSRTVTLAVSEQLQVPAAIGFFQPLIVLPAWSMQELSAEELNSILIHELAHLCRWDDWTNLAQKLLRALFFFHPAIWWVEGQVSLEREMACDDIVLSKSVSPRSYAECLVSVAEKSFTRRSLALAQAAVSRMRHTTKRVSQILDRNRSGATHIWKPALGLVTVFSAIFLVIGSRAPEMIAFNDAVPSVAAVRAVSVPVINARWSEPAARPVAGSSRTNHKTRPSLKKAIPVRHQPVSVVGDVNSLDAQLVQLPQSVYSLLPATEIALPLDGRAVQTVFVLVQSAEYSPSQGSWTLCVWRVTVRSDRIPIEIFPTKSI